MKTQRTPLRKITKLSIIVSAILFAQTSIAQTMNFQTYLHTKEVAKAVTATPFSVSIKRDVNSNKFILLIDNPQLQKITVTVANKLSDYFYDRTTSKTYHKRFNLSDAEDGAYIIEVTNGKHTFTKKYSNQHHHRS